MSVRRRGAPVLWAMVLALSAACAGAPPPIAAPESGATAVDSERVLSLRRRAEGFYLRLAYRRFNTLETYNDFIMRDHFRSLDLFFDYYADLAEDLALADFEKSRPTRIEVLEFLFEDSETAKVLVRFHGDDGRPLRPGAREIVRTDRWERADGIWWILPGKL
ncbi:MAG: hypothetical protein AAF430_26435 [Myxococcota bacterium]